MGVHIELEEKHNMITVTEKAPHFIDYTITTPTMTMKQTAEGSILIGGGREGYGVLIRMIRKKMFPSMAFALIYGKLKILFRPFRN